MGITGALKVLSVLKKGGVIAAKNAPKAIEIIDATADTAMLADQVAMLSLGKNYDSGFRDKVVQVLDAGKEVDLLVHNVKSRNKDVANLHAAIDNLNFQLELNADKNEVTIGLMDKIGAISETLKDTPTALTWIQGPASRTDTHLDVDTLTKSIAAIENYRGQISFDPARTGLLAAALLLKATVTGFLRRTNKRAKKRTAINLDPSDLRPAASAGRNRANAVGSMDMLPPEERKIIKNIRPKTKFTIALDVTSKTASAVSLGFTIVSIVNRVKSRKAAFKAMQEQLDLYNNADHAYRYTLHGFDGDENAPGAQQTSVQKSLAKAADKLAEAQRRAVNITESSEDPKKVSQALDRARAAFNKALLASPEFLAARNFMQEKGEQEWSVSENIGFALGLDGLIDSYNLEGKQKITAIRNIFEEMYNVLSDELNSDDPTDRIAAEYVEDKGAKDRIEAYKQSFEGFATIAMDTIKSGADRKDRGFDPIQETFGASIQKLLSQVLEDAENRLRDIRMASQLYVGAQMILERAEEERQKQVSLNANALETQSKTAEMVRGFLKTLGRPHSDADVRAEMEKQGLIEPAKAFDLDAYLERERSRLARAEWTGSDLDTRNSSRFSSVTEVEFALGLMLEDLQEKASSGAA